MKLGLVCLVVLGATGCAMVNKPVMDIGTALNLSGFKAGADVCKEFGHTYAFNDKYYARVVESLRERFDINKDIESSYQGELKRKTAYYKGVEPSHLETVCDGLNDVALQYMNLNYKMKNEYDARQAQAKANFSKAMAQISASLQTTGQQMQRTGRAALQSTSQAMPVYQPIYTPQASVSPPAVRNRMEGLTNPANRLNTRSVLTKSTFHQGMYQCDYANGQRRFSYTGCAQFWGD